MTMSRPADDAKAGRGAAAESTGRGEPAAVPADSGATARPTAAFEIRPLRTLADRRACIALQKATWGEHFGELVPGSHLMLIERIGGIAAGAFDADGELIGFVYGITGIEDGRPVHWSDMLAVRPEYREHGLGVALKSYQRDRLLRLGVETVYWTFDPLESKNAYINFVRLGVVSDEYHRDLYGETESPVHEGIGTDRFVVRWPIATDRVARRLARREPTADPEAARELPLANPTGLDPTGRPRSEPPELDIDAPRLRIAVPAEIQALKSAEPRLAADWRRTTRAAFEHYLDRGYTAVDFLREHALSFYILART